MSEYCKCAAQNIWAIKDTTFDWDVVVGTKEECDEVMNMLQK
jgi:hypothetical protein